MSVSSFIPEVWSSALLSTLKKNQVFGNIVNRNYEGEISQAGDTVHITTIGRPTIATYIPNTTVITPEVLNTTDRALVVDQAKYFAFEIDDVDRRQALGGLMEEAMSEAAYALSDVTDTYLAAKYIDVPAVNKVNSGTAVAVTTGDIFFTQATKLMQKLDEANVPRAGRWIVIPPWLLALLTDSTKFNANPNNSINASTALENGLVARLTSFDLYVSNNVVLVTGDDYAILAGTNQAITFAEQISKTEAYRPQSSFADAIKGLHVYGSKTVRPECLAYLLASQT